MNKNWRQDISGGAAAAFTGLPVELVYGLLAVAPLGAAYAEQGLRAALWGCVLSGLLGVLLRTGGGMIAGTRPATGLILGALASSLLTLPDIQASADPAASVFALILACTALAGGVQAAFGLIGVGKSLKYVPYPVLAGLMCGIGILMAKFAVKPILGIPLGNTWENWATDWHPLSLLVGIVAFALCSYAGRFTQRIPAPLVALLGGTLLHHGLSALFGSDLLGPTVSGASGLLPRWFIWDIPLAGGSAFFLAYLPVLFPYALAIAAFASLESLLCLSAIEAVQQARSNGDRQLISHGVSNVFIGLLGGTTIVGNLSRVMANLSAGGRTGLSAVAYSVIIASIVIFAAPLSSTVPGAVTAGILFFYAQAMFDEGSRRLAKQVLTGRRHLPAVQYRVLAANFMVIVLVALVAAIGHMMQALLAGTAAAIFLFVKSSMKPVIRQVTTARHRRSLKVRALPVLDKLEELGEQIVLIEVDGPLFFGTADRAALEIEKASQHSSWVILDLKRVKEIDTTGARILLRIGDILARQKKSLFFCGMSQSLIDFLRAMGLKQPLHQENWFPDVDDALEAAENELLAGQGIELDMGSIGLGDTALAAGLDPVQREHLAAYLRRSAYEAGAAIFKKGECSYSLFVAQDAAVDILIPIAPGRDKRVASFAPGNVFGEMALLEHKPRSADAILHAASIVWELTEEGLDQLRLDHPEIATQIMFNLSRVLAHRLRTTTDELSIALEAA